MVNESDLNILVSNVISENHHKHCRLCLRDLTESEYVRFEDCVSLDDDIMFQELSEVLDDLLGPEVCQEIPGVDAVCSKCVEEVLKCRSFLAVCKKTNTLLHKVFDNLFEALNITVENDSDQRLYVLVGEHESKVVLMDKEQVQTPKTKNSVEIKVEDTCKLECETCQKVFTYKSELIEHKKNDHQYTCPHCNQHRCSEQSLKEHLDKAHNIYVCKHCGKSCHGLDKLEAHEKRHSNTKQQCPKCDKLYLTHSSYIKHVELCLAEKLDRHPFRGKSEKNISCSKCGKSYSTVGGLRVHMRFVHGNASPHICEHCGKKFTAPSYLRIHMVKHTGEKNFNCNICTKKFVSKEALLYHTRRHTGEKPFSCNLCSEKFVNASSRAEHIKFKHAGPTLTCDICHRKYFTMSFLKQHRKRHSDPFSKLYTGRSTVPPNVPGEENRRLTDEFCAVRDESESFD